MRTSRVLKRCLLIYILIAAFLSVADAEKIDKAELVGAIARTMPLTHVDVPVQLSGEATLRRGGKKTNGTYVLTINSPQQWREEIGLTDYQELHVNDGSKLYIARSAPVPDLASMLVFRAMHEASYIRPSGEAKIKAREQKFKDLKLQCAEITEPGNFYGAESEVCFYPDGTVARTSMLGDSYSFFDYAPVGTRSLPQHIVITHDGETTVDIRVNKVTPNPLIKEERFRDPANAKELRTCEVVTKREQLNNRVPPRYPAQARMAGIQGAVALYAFVNADGRITDLRTLQSSRKELEQASVEAVRQWAYTPRMCGSTPIPFETLITVNYSLGP